MENALYIFFSIVIALMIICYPEKILRRRFFMKYTKKTKLESRK